MEITITNCRHTPRWATLQEVIREVFDDDSALIVRISRPDGGCDYRKHGVYNLDVLSCGTTLPVKLVCNP